MNGPDHYRKAEELLDEAARRMAVERGVSVMDLQAVTATAQVAQVHATLALAAATAGDRIRMPGLNDTALDTTPAAYGWEKAIE